MSKRKAAGSEEAMPAPAISCSKPALGRKRDQSLDGRVLEATIDTLAEVGFDCMTMDMVAARAKAGKATLYRRWPSKPELVRDALIWMSHGSVDLEHMPDTGSLRNDLLALLKPYSTEFGERKLHVLSKLGSYFSAHPKASEEAIAGIFDPWTAVNRCLMQRAIARGEISEHADIETACQVIVAVTSHRSLGRHNSFGNLDYATLLDNILLPALKNPTTKL